MKYQAHIDIPLDEEWEDIEVLSLVVSGDNPEEAMENAAIEVSKEHEDYYVWEISEDDELKDEDS